MLSFFHSIMKHQISYILLLLLLSFKSNAQCTGTLSGSTTVDDFTISIKLDCETEKIQLDIEYNNYNNNYFGIVFHHTMIHHPALVYTTGKNADKPAALYTYDLQAKGSDGVIYNPTNDWTKISTTTQPNYYDTTIKIIYEQDLSKTEFHTSTTTIGFRIVTGTSLQLLMHNHKTAHTTITLTQDTITSIPPSSNTTPITPQPTSSTIHPMDLSECAGNDEWSASGTFDKFDIILTINCVSETIRLNITYNEYKYNWFGIVFNNEMEGDAVIYTSGKSGTLEPRLYFYSISGMSSSGVQYKEIFNWNEIETSIINDGIRVIYEQDLSKTNWDINTNEIPMRWAIGGSNDMRLMYHESRASYTQHFNFVSGGYVKHKDNIYIYIVHGIIMWIAWAVFASIGIMISAFRWLVPNKPKGCWFQMHRVVQVMVIILHVIGVIIAIIIVQDSGVEHFSNNHMIMGLTVTILVVLQPLNAIFRPHPATGGTKTPMKRLIWEIMHKFLGYSAWIIACITAYLGFSLPVIDESGLGYLHLFGWCLLLFIVYMVLTMIGCSRNKSDPPMVSVNVNTDGSDESEELVGDGDKVNL
eukprot:304935_1